MCLPQWLMDLFDVRFPSVYFEYVLLPLGNKEPGLAYGMAEYN